MDNDVLKIAIYNQKGGVGKLEKTVKLTPKKRRKLTP